MATFRPNPNSQNDPWIESAAFEDSPFRKWHLMFFCFSGFTLILVIFCCCVKFRIPRTKQEIEADYQRKKLTEKFRERLRLIQNQQMEVIDLQKALEIIQEDYKNEKKSIDEKVSSSAFPAADSNLASATTDNFENSRAEPQQPSGRGFIFHKIASTFARSGGLIHYQ